MPRIYSCPSCPWPAMNLLCGTHNARRTWALRIAAAPSRAEKNRLRQQQIAEEAEEYKELLRCRQKGYFRPNQKQRELFERMEREDECAKRNSIARSSRSAVQEMEREIRFEHWKATVGKQLIEEAGRLQALAFSRRPPKRHAPVAGPRRTALYRYFDSEGSLLYVGIAYDPDVRASAHRRTSHWYPSASRRVDEWFEDRKKAQAAEIKAIESERPRHNVRHAVLTAS